MLQPRGLSSSEMFHLHSAIDTAAIVAITDARGIITYANSKFCQISGYPEDELIGRTHRVVNSGKHPREFFVDMWTKINNGEVWTGEICNRSRQGNLYWVHTTIVPFLNDAGYPEKFVSVRFDITEQKLKEQRLQETSESLAANNQELKDFASVAAHDLQEPLRKIQVFSDLVVQNQTQNLDNETKDYLKRIQTSAKRMNTLINDLLSYTKLTAREIPFAEVDLNVVLQEAMSNLEIKIQETRAQVHAEELPTIKADRGQMIQLFQNLIKNSIVYKSPDRIPEVQISTRMLETATPFYSKQFIELSFTDNGIGFDEKYLDRIFKIFQRLHGRYEYEGTGIGLAICRKIVSRHNGHITAQSKPNEGARFIITLPID